MLRCGYEGCSGGALLFVATPGVAGNDSRWLRLMAKADVTALISKRGVV